MDDKQIDATVKAIAKAEASGDEQEAGNMRQELFTSGIDTPEIDSLVEKASKKRAKKDDGTFTPDDKTTPDTNEAFETGKSPAKKSAAAKK